MNELTPNKITSTLEEVVGASVHKTVGSRQVDSATTHDARLDFEWEERIHFTHPATWTEDETKHAFVELAARLARAQSFMIIGSLPDEVVPIILPQLHEMAEYEIRMWQIREEVEGPDIRERWVSLPIAT